jgi:hypothetical protein
MAGYMVFANNNLVDARDTLEQAQAVAMEHVRSGTRVRIESLVAPAPSQFWYYDRVDGAWTVSDHRRDPDAEL